MRGTYASSLVSGSLMHVIAAARGAAVGGDADRLQVDHPGRVGGGAAGLRLRGGARLRGRPRPWRGTRTASPAALAVALLAAELKATGRTLLDRLDELAAEHGLFVTGQLSVRVEDLTLISDAMARLRARAAVAAAGPRRWRSPTWRSTDPPVDAVRLLGDGVRVIVRPSGTEPKLKAYLETVVPVHEDAGLIAARGRGEDELDQLRAEMSAALGL